jgi:hypothetical protein
MRVESYPKVLLNQPDLWVCQYDQKNLSKLKHAKFISSQSKPSTDLIKFATTTQNC